MLTLHLVSSRNKAAVLTFARNVAAGKQREPDHNLDCLCETLTQYLSGRRGDVFPEPERQSCIHSLALSLRQILAGKPQPRAKRRIGGLRILATSWSRE